jgi:hypothetical protein
MNIVDALVAHHSDLRQLFNQAKTNPAVVDDYIRHLTVHHTMEEKYFYDLFQNEAQARHDALEAVNEHHIIEMIIKDVDKFPREHEYFSIKVEALGEYTNHHLDEEETIIFPLARQVWSEEALIGLGGLFLQAKEMLLGIVLPEAPQSIAALGGKPAKKPGSLLSPAKPAGEESKPVPAVEKFFAVGLGIGSLKK